MKGNPEFLGVTTYYVLRVAYQEQYATRNTYNFTPESLRIHIVNIQIHSSL